MKKLIFALIILFVGINSLSAQTYFPSGHSALDKTLLNPGFSLSADDWAASLTAKNFLLPSTLSVKTLHANLFKAIGTNKRHGFHTSLMGVRVGPYRWGLMKFSYSHNIPVGNWNFTGGVTLGYNHFKTELDGFAFSNPNIKEDLNFLTGDVHFLIQYANWFAGISTDNLLKTTSYKSYGADLSPYFNYSVGGDIKISERVLLLPILQIRQSNTEIPVTYELGLATELYDKINLGAGIISMGAYSFMAGFDFDRFLLGYTHIFFDSNYIQTTFYSNHLVKFGYNLP